MDWAVGGGAGKKKKGKKTALRLGLSDSGNSGGIFFLQRQTGSVTQQIRTLE